MKKRGLGVIPEIDSAPGDGLRDDTLLDPTTAPADTPHPSGSAPPGPPPALRVFGGLASVEDYRLAARRRLPRGIFDFVDGGAGNEHTLRGNEAAFRRYAFRPRVLTDVSGVDISATVLGRGVGMPVFLGPSGAQRLVSRGGELAAVRAAARYKTVYVLSVSSTFSLEEVADAGQGASLWFQLYLWKDHDWARQLIDRARAAGYDALCVTVDIKAPGGRKYRDIRNGIARMPESLGPSVMLDGARHPRWLSGYLRSWPIKTAHISSDGRGGGSIFRATKETWRRMDPAATWDEISWLRRVWSGPLIVKGILTAEDAELAFQHGADAVVCSKSWRTSARRQSGEPARPATHRRGGPAAWQGGLP